MSLKDRIIEGLSSVVRELDESELKHLNLGNKEPLGSEAIKTIANRLYEKLDSKETLISPERLSIRKIEEKIEKINIYFDPLEHFDSPDQKAADQLKSKLANAIYQEIQFQRLIDLADRLGETAAAKENKEGKLLLKDALEKNKAHVKTTLAQKKLEDINIHIEHLSLQRNRIKTLGARFEVQKSTPPISPQNIKHTLIFFGIPDSDSLSHIASQTANIVNPSGVKAPSGSFFGETKEGTTKEAAEAKARAEADARAKADAEAKARAETEAKAKADAERAAAEAKAKEQAEREAAEARAKAEAEAKADAERERAAAEAKEQAERAAAETKARADADAKAEADARAKAEAAAEAARVAAENEAKKIEAERMAALEIARINAEKERLAKEKAEKLEAKRLEEAKIQVAEETKKITNLIAPLKNGIAAIEKATNNYETITVEHFGHIKSEFDKISDIKKSIAEAKTLPSNDQKNYLNKAEELGSRLNPALTRYLKQKLHIDIARFESSLLSNDPLADSTEQAFKKAQEAKTYYHAVTQLFGKDTVVTDEVQSEATKLISLQKIFVSSCK